MLDLTLIESLVLRNMTYSRHFHTHWSGMNVDLPSMADGERVIGHYLNPEPYNCQDLAFTTLGVHLRSHDFWISYRYADTEEVRAPPSKDLARGIELRCAGKDVFLPCAGGEGVSRDAFLPMSSLIALVDHMRRLKDHPQ